VYDGDGMNQYLPIYIFWSRYLRTVLKNIFILHNFIIPQWSFSIGEGADIISTLSYNIVGDPFCFLSFLVPTQYMYIYYSVMSLFRLYCAGLAFAYLCFYKGHNNNYAVLTGAFCYIFFHFGILNVVRHPHFLNAMIYFPLTIVGAEKIITEKNPKLFICSIFISAFTSFYFFYMLALLTIVYVLTRLFTMHVKNIKTNLNIIIHFLSFGLLGMGLSSVILVPTLYAVLQDSREGMLNKFPFLYELQYYLRLPSIFTTITERNHWLCLGFPIISIPCFFNLIKGKDTKLEKNLLIVCCFFIFFPVFGLILNGFQYPSNRWCWGFSLLSGYIVVSQYKSLNTINIKLFCLSIIPLLLFSYIFVGISNAINGLLNTIILTSLLILLKKFKSSLTRNRIILFYTLLSIFTNSLFLFSKYGQNYASTGTTSKDLFHLLNNETTNIKLIESTENSPPTFFRYSGHELSRDVSMISNLSVVQHYVSLSNPKIQEFREKLEYNQSGNLHSYMGYDDRTVLDAISAVKYYYIPEQHPIRPPFGFEQTEINTIYRNSYFLPLVFTYENIIARVEWEKLTAIQKQETLIQNAVLEQNPKHLASKYPMLISKTVDSSITTETGIHKNGNTLIITKPNTHATISFTGQHNSETYLRLENIYYNDIAEYDIALQNNQKLSLFKKTKLLIKKILKLKKSETIHIYFNTSKGINKVLDYKTPAYTWYANRHTFCINLGYSETPLTEVDVTFEDPGEYTIGNIEVICQPMDNYENQINALKQDIFENEEISTNSVKGNISLDKTKFLYFSIPYSKGWTAYIDGKKTELLQANIMHMGIFVEQGKHVIELKYKTPFLTIGLIISIISFIVLLSYMILEKLHKVRGLKHK
jgi:uncharacterized membrane protein YfhO